MATASGPSIPLPPASLQQHLKAPSLLPTGPIFPWGGEDSNCHHLFLTPLPWRWQMRAEPRICSQGGGVAMTQLRNVSPDRGEKGVRPLPHSDSFSGTFKQLPSSFTPKNLPPHLLWCLLPLRGLTPHGPRGGLRRSSHYLPLLRRSARQVGLCHSISFNPPRTDPWTDPAGQVSLTHFSGEEKEGQGG